MKTLTKNKQTINHGSITMVQQSSSITMVHDQGQTNFWGSASSLKVEQNFKNFAKLLVRVSLVLKI